MGKVGKWLIIVNEVTLRNINMKKEKKSYSARIYKYVRYILFNLIILRLSNISNLSKGAMLYIRLFPLRTKITDSL